MQGQKSLKVSPDCIRLGFLFVPVLSVCCFFEALVGSFEQLGEIGPGSSRE